MSKPANPQDLEQQFRALVALLNKKNIPYAVAGALAASIYRSQPRTTNDIDIITLADTANVEELKSILEELGLKPGLARQANLDGGPLFAIKKKSTPVVLLVGRNQENKQAIGIDFLLSSLPWVEKALERAQEFDYGGIKAPVMTAEDVILAKLLAVHNKPTRLSDLDDIVSIVETGRDIDWAYISSQIKELRVKLRKEHAPLLPKQIRDAARNV